MYRGLLSSCRLAVTAAAVRRRPVMTWAMAAPTTAVVFATATVLASGRLGVLIRADGAVPVPVLAAGVDVISHADVLYTAGKTRELYDLLLPYAAAEFATPKLRAEALWRLARAEHDLALVATDKAAKERLVLSALQHANEALQLDPTNFACSKWAGITLSDVGDFAGTTQKISNAYTIRDHFAKAVELNPADATSHHLMGVWCFTFADMGWAMRRAASLIFGTPPSCTYDEARTHFAKAEAIDPKFYKKNLVMLATTLHRLGETAKAKATLREALSIAVANADDEAAHAEGLKLASTLGGL